MRRQLPKARHQLDSHAGLLLQRFVSHAPDGSEQWPPAKRDILEAALTATPCELYRTAFERWIKLLPSLTAARDLQTQGRLIVGLGSENVLETGIRLHHIYGVPIIPGSALKGLAAHYSDRVWGLAEEKFKKCGSYHRLIFGSTDDSGCIVFHDAWLKPGSEQPLKLDVMTPHHPDYNRDPTTDPKFRAPTDFDSPIPVPFLSVTGSFHVAVSWHAPRRDDAKNWTELALSLLCEALKDWGIGGKTTSGYGRLIVPPPPSPPRPPAKRASGAKAAVKIVAPRPKGGFEVQDVEPGRAPGTLTLGTPPADADTNPGAVVDVLVHVDELKRPQYKWPPAPKK